VIKWRNYGPLSGLKMLTNDGAGAKSLVRGLVRGVSKKGTMKGGGQSELENRVLDLEPQRVQTLH